MEKEQAVREAAGVLKAAIAEAVVAGYRVEWPARADDLDHIAISETAQVVQPEPVIAPAQDQPVAEVPVPLTPPKKSKFSGI